MGKFIVDKRLARDARKRGFTLMELMVYIAIVGIVVIVAGQAFSNSTKMRVRTQSMLKASEVAENVAALFKQDVAQTGAKSSMETHATDGSNDTFSGIKREVYMDPKVDGDPDDKVEDLSSFKFVPASPAANASLEKFITRRVRYDAAGKYQSVEEITWFLDGKTLKRQCVVVDDGTAGDDCAPKGTAGADHTRSRWPQTLICSRFCPLFPTVLKAASTYSLLHRESRWYRAQVSAACCRLFPELAAHPYN